MADLPEFIVFRPDRHSVTHLIGKRLIDGSYVEVARCHRNDAEDLLTKLNRRDVTEADFSGTEVVARLEDDEGPIVTLAMDRPTAEWLLAFSLERSTERWWLSVADALQNEGVRPRD